MTLFHSLGILAASGVSGAAPGMVLVSPTSIAYSGTSATLGANGQVTFSAVTSLSLNGCFTADFDNYVVSIRCSSSSATNVSMRLRVSGSDNSTSNSYVYQTIYADNTSVAASRTTGNIAVPFAAYPTQRDGTTFFLYGPYLAQPTAARCVTALGYTSAYLFDTALTHNQSTAYDGFTISATSAGSPTLTGALQVYGIRS